MSDPTIVTRAGWGARAPRGTVHRTTWGQRVGVAIHHTAGPTGQTARAIQDHQMDNNGWVDLGYNWMVTQDGRIWEGRSGGWLAIGAHVAGHNTGWIGVCWIGTSGSTAPSAAALRSLRWLVDEARRLAGRTLPVRGHGQLGATECPGSRLRAWISDGMPVAGPPAGSGGNMAGKEVAQHSIPRRPLTLGDWPHLSKTVRIQTILDAIYRFSRWSRDHSVAARRAAEDNGEKLDAILAAVGGAGAEEIKAQLAEQHQQKMAVLAEQATRLDELGEALDAAADERADLAELVRQGASGELDAAEVVRLIGERLTAPAPAPAEDAEDAG